MPTTSKPFRRLARKGEARIYHKARLLFHTLRHSKPRQIISRLTGLAKKNLVLLHPPLPPYTLGDKLSPTVPFLHHDSWNRRDEIGGGNFRFLNRDEYLGRPVDWRAASLPALWRYNLHYFNYLFLLDPPEQESLCLEWVRANPLAKGTAWHPFPTSLRIVNWCKARLVNPELRRSLYRQAAYLYRHMEWHHLGNHLLENARALVFAGSGFAGEGEADRWLARGVEIYRRQTPRQILADGGHFERSPMYHALVLEGYLDVINLLPGGEDKEALIEAAKPMSDFLISVTHPDGAIALFNDSTREIAPPTDLLLSYAESLTGHRAKPKDAFAETGYFIHRSEGLFLILDGGRIGPDFLPAHAHADIFSYELSLGGEPLIVDAGVYEYEAGAMRGFVRSTRAHNTVTVDGADQAECWGSFRVARRFPPDRVSFHRTGSCSRFQGAFGGFAKLVGDGIVHKRAVSCDESRREIVVEDVVEGRGEHLVESLIHLHPDVELRVEGRRATLTVREVRCVIEAGEGPIMVEDSWYCPEFGLKRRNQALVLGGRRNLPSTVSYRLSY